MPGLQDSLDPPSPTQGYSCIVIVNLSRQLFYLPLHGNWPQSRPCLCFLPCHTCSATFPRTEKALHPQDRWFLNSGLFLYPVTAVTPSLLSRGSKFLESICNMTARECLLTRLPLFTMTFVSQKIWIPQS